MGDSSGVPKWLRKIFGEKEEVREPVEEVPEPDVKEEVEEVGEGRVNEDGDVEKEKDQVVAEWVEPLGVAAILLGGIVVMKGILVVKDVLDRRRRRRGWKSSEPSLEPERPSAGSPSVMKMWSLYARLWDLLMELDPIGATMAGDHRFDHMLADLSLEGRRNALARLEGLRIELEQLGLSEIHAVGELDNFLFLQEMLKMEIRSRETFNSYEFPSNHILGHHLFLAQAANIHPWGGQNDANTFLNRLTCFQKQSGQIIDAFSYGIRERRTWPAKVVHEMIKQCELQWVTLPEESPIYRTAYPHVQNIGGDVRELKRVIQDCVVPGYRAISHFLKEKYLPHARKDPGLASLPQGQKIYAGCIEYYATTGKSPASLHAIGLEEVERIHARIKGIRAQLPFPDLPLADFVEKLHLDPSLFAATGQDIIDRYFDLLLEAQKRIPSIFLKIPSAPMDVKAIEPFREASAPPAHYFPMDDNGSDRAIFYANTLKPETRPFYTMEAIALHEGVPGHHLQLSIAQEMRNLPRLRRHLQHFCLSYAEGWGLYAEYLGEVLGFYEEPINLFGRLLTEMMRACRLVVDTGIHGLGWSRDKAASYLRENAALPPDEIESELESIVVFPGQALAYKVGELKILELKEKGQESLGERFNWKSFHHTALRSGTVPLSMLERNVDDWIRCELRLASAGLSGTQL